MDHFRFSQAMETASIQVESSLVWELIMGIAGYTHENIRHTFELDEKWSSEHEAMPEGLLNHLKLMQETNMWYGLVMLQNRFSASSIQDFSDQLERLPLEEFYETLLPYGGRELEEARRQLAHNHSKQELFTAYADCFQDHDYLSSYVLSLASHRQENLCRLMTATLEEWYGWVNGSKEWDKWMQALSFEQKENRTVDQMKPIEAIERITGGVRYIPEPSVWHIKLIPHVSYRPWTLELRTSDTKLLFYPLKEEYLLEPGVPANSLVRGHKALGDGLRLKLLYQLLQGPLSLQEMSIHFSISKTTLHHQLSILKSAGFVKVNKGIYSANAEEISKLSKRLSKFLGGNT